MKRIAIQFIVNFGLLTLPLFSLAQTENHVLTYQNYIKSVWQQHPIAQKANLKLAFAKAELLKAKGNFDPSLYSDLNNKNFNDKLYYNQFGANIKVPTPIGLDVVGGYENATGAYLNPESNTTNNGLWHLGVELNVLQGLLINERRTALKQASSYQDLAKSEQEMLLNDLLYNASFAYFQWQLYEHNQNVFQENLQLAKTYWENTVLSFQGGEKTAIDTLEAYILYQDAIITLQKNNTNLIKTKLHLENFLWYNNQAIGLQNHTQPESIENTMLQIDEILESPNAFRLNPSINFYQNKLNILNIEQKLKQEKLKPKLKLKYSPLLSTTTNSFAPNYSANNYKWGFTFAMPLFLRTERANVQQGKIKIQELGLDLENKQNELSIKERSAKQQIQILKEQKNLIEQNTENYKKLLEGESIKFQLGESSVFLLNKRQEKYIDSRLKLLETQTKLHLEQLNLLYYTNQLIAQ